MVLVVVGVVGASAYYIYNNNKDVDDVSLQENSEDPDENADTSDGDDLNDIEDQAVTDEEELQQ